jgi:hypothetical protein
MANSAPSEASDFDTKIIAEFRTNQGRVGGPLAGTPMILIHHTGAQAHAGIGDEVAAILVGRVAPRVPRLRREPEPRPGARLRFRCPGSRARSSASEFRWAPSCCSLRGSSLLC